MVELNKHSKTGLMKRIDRYKRSRKRNFINHLNVNDKHKFMCTRSMSTRSSLKLHKSGNSSNNSSKSEDSNASTHTTSPVEHTKQSTENNQTINSANEILGHIIKNEILHFGDKSAVDRYISVLPKIDGISYDKQLNCFKSRVPLRFTNNTIEDSFFVKNYGFKNAWLKAIGSLYTNIAFIVFDYPQIINRLRPNKYLHFNAASSALGSAIREGESKLKTMGTRPLKGAINASVSSNSASTNGSIGDLLSSSVEDVLDVLNNMSERAKVADLNNSPEARVKVDQMDDSELYEALLSTTRGKKIPQPIGEDPKQVAESLKPWHEHIFWIPSICRWRTLYYDADSVKHSKTFTPAFFGGVREAYYAAVEFRNMIDSMDKLTQSKIRRKWIQSSLPLGISSLASNESSESSSTKCDSRSSSDSSKQKAESVDSKLIKDDKKANTGSIETKDRGKKADKNSNLGAVSRFNNIVGCGHYVVDHLAKYVAKRRMDGAESTKTDEPEDSGAKSGESSHLPNENESVDDGKLAKGSKLAKRGRPLKKRRLVNEGVLVKDRSLTENNRGDDNNCDPANENKADGYNKKIYKDSPLGYDVNFLSGLDKKGLFIPIPLDWKGS